MNEPHTSELAHTQGPQDVLGVFEVGVDAGLTAREVSRRRARYGANILRQKPPANAALILLHQFNSPIVFLLATAAVIALMLGENVEFLAIVIVLAINATIGFVTEWRAVKSMEALRALSSLTAVVRRDGRIGAVPAEELVPGDIVVLEAGDVVTADLRLVGASNLFADESALTGESLPVAKSIDAVVEDTPLAERTCMLYKGCAVTSGTGTGVVVASGMQTELGRITQLVESAESARSPLTEKLEGLSKALIWVTLAVAALVAALGLATGRDATLMIGSAVALAVAAIPEGLPIVATLALARGMLRMARRNALIEQLAAVETLGATTVILTDKTGTLTENAMHVAQVLIDGTLVRFDHSSGRFVGEDSAELNSKVSDLMEPLLWASVACTNAEIGEADAGVGDPMEIALLAAARARGIERDAVFSAAPRIREIAFDTQSRRMASLHQQGAQCRLAVKGAPEAVLAICTHWARTEGIVALDEVARAKIDVALDAMAAQGLRLLAIAGKTETTKDCSPYEGLTLFGVVGLNDPPRTDIAQALRECKSAGIRVVMVTGDHATTARAIAREIGLAGDSDRAMGGSELGAIEALDREKQNGLRQVAIFSRVTPEQKLNLIALHQSAGEVVAMTGDGVNDAPALKKADIGVAMGRRGTQVAREAADMVLRDDAFSTIVAAIAEGRAIWANIRRFTVYLLSCNLSEILIVGLAILAGLPLPLLPLQILFLNLVTDVFPAFALGTIAGGSQFLNRPPRDPSEPLIGGTQWRAIVAHGAVIALSTLAALILGATVLKLEGAALTTISFYTLALAQLWHVFNMRNWRDGFFINPITRSPWIWGALVLCVGLIAGAAMLPATAYALELTALPLPAYALCVGLSVVPLVVRNGVAILVRLKRKGANGVSA